MEAKPSPAPWSAARNTSNGWIKISAPDGTAIANVKAWKDVDLIKAAPDLLTALHEIADWTERYTTPGHPIATVARAAIAKATGAA